MKLFIDLEDQRFIYLKDFLCSEQIQYTNKTDDADVLILGIHKKELPRIKNNAIVLSFHPIKKCNNRILNESEKFLQKNAYLTALGLLKQINIKNKKIVIFGNGRIAKALKHEINAPIHIICRHPKEDEEYMDSKAYIDADIIINTIPYPIDIDWQKVKKNSEIIELASAPYGFNIPFLKQQGYNARLLSGIPGKVFPKEAALLIYEEVVQCLKV